MSDNPELKAGHPPAVKVGGMRVVTKHKQHGGKPDQDTDAYDDKYQDTTVYNPMGPTVKVDVKDITTIPDGSQQSTDKTHSTDAVKVAHDFHSPTKEKHATKKPMMIQQPQRR